jgi:NADP-dependent 3-hydroxy acid dehydrogenase YdfG
MKDNIESKVVVITGASSGIGEATAILLAQRGAKVVLGARGLERLKALADRIEQTGRETAYIQTDVTRRRDLDNLIKLACERFGKLDVLVNNAGIAPTSLLDELRVARRPESRCQRTADNGIGIPSHSL